MADEFHTEFALEGRNLEVEGMLIAIKDSDTTLAGLLVGRVCINFMSIWCLVRVSFGVFNPDIAFKKTGDFIIDFITGHASNNRCANTCGFYGRLTHK
jgi:hypothetical protein